MGPMGAVEKRVLDSQSLKRLHADWQNPDITLAMMMVKYSLGHTRIKAHCAHLPPRVKLQKLKRRAPSGLLGLL